MLLQSAPETRVPHVQPSVRPGRVAQLLRPAEIDRRNENDSKRGREERGREAETDRETETERARRERHPTKTTAEEDGVGKQKV